MADRTSTFLQEFKAEGHIKSSSQRKSITMIFSQTPIQKRVWNILGLAGVFATRLRFDFEFGYSPSNNTNRKI